MAGIFIIIPAYNETEVIASTIKPLIEKGYEVVVVDDGSAKSVETYLDKLPVHFLRHDINLGQGAALQTGMEYAKQFNPDYVVHFDADGQHNFSDIDHFISLLEEKKVDIILGSRFLKEESIQLVPKKRRSLLKIARVINYFFTGLMLTDAHNGFRVMKGSVLNKIRLTEKRMAHATEILKLIKKNKIKFAEGATEIRYTDYSLQKGQKAVDSVNILIDLIINRFVR